MSDFSELSPWGWNARWLHAWNNTWQAGLVSDSSELSHLNLMPARVSGREGPSDRLETSAGTRLGHVSGRFRHGAAAGDLPLVGDWVAVQIADHATAVIHAVLPRQTFFSRAVTQGSMQVRSPLAANIDILGIVTGLDGNFNPRRAQRLATLARQGGILPLWILTKTDLPGAEEKVRLAQKAAGQDPVLALSPLTGDGLDQLQPWLKPGLTLALSGSSGVGKTTLVNRLLERSDLDTGGVRELDSKGRHTTTSRHLYPMATGCLLMDTPGFRTVGLWADDDALGSSFADITDLARQCRFDDCRHEGEPGCAVRQALDAGELSMDRWKGWLKQVREVRYLERQGDPVAERAERDRWRSIHLGARKFSKERRAKGG